ncbi:LRRN4 C-terminal-like protein [Engystomops pustulosus]|uniref:LRRN4 C-terminal-like protein n=1 Tax=Engystomops pustulosus TaxID=76066 RepID=UPI003AFACD09
MAPPLPLLLLPLMLFTSGFTEERIISISLTPDTPTSDINQTSVTQRPTQSRQTTPERIKFIVGGSDYEYEDDETTVAYTSPGPKLSCQYDRCEHLAPTCEEIQRKAGGHCLCPGIYGPEYKPEFPPLKEVLIGETQMTVHWCSPSSTVRGYRVLHGEPGGSMEKGPELNASFRSYTIENLKYSSPYIVCVVAFNEAGESQVDDGEEKPVGGLPGPCRSVYTSMQTLYIGIGIGLAAVVGLMIILGYFLWTRKANKTKRGTNLDKSGTTNYIYKAGSIDPL